MLAGVADHLGIDVAVARILFVVLGIFTHGVMIVAYVLGWVLIPEETDEEAAMGRPARREDVGGRDPLFWIGIATLIIGAVWLLGGPLGRPGVLPFFGGRGVILPLVLIAFGIALWRAADRTPGGRVPPAGPVPYGGGPRGWGAPAQTGVWSQPGGPSQPGGSPQPGGPPHPGLPPSGGPDHLGGPALAGAPIDPARPDDSRPETAMPSDDARTDTVRLDRPGAGPGGRTTAPPPGWQAPPPGVPPHAPREGGDDGRDWTPPPVPPSRGVATRITLGAALLTVGVLWLLDVAEVAAFAPGQMVSAALLVVGVGLLVSSIVGRGRGLIGAGLLILPVVLVLQVAQPFPTDVFGPGSQSTGQRFETPRTEAEVQDAYRLGAGELHLDLSEVAFTEDRDISLQVGFGNVRVIVPADVTVEVTGQSGAGEMGLLGSHNSGVGIDRTVIDEVPGSDVGLTLDVQVGFGQAFVTRAASSEDDGPSAGTTDDTDPELEP